MLSQLFGTEAPDHAPHGTLIIGVSTVDGFLLCADKRVTKSTGEFSDTDTKIFALGTDAAFMTNGESHWISATGQVMFNAETIVRDYFADKSVKDIKDHLGVGEVLRAAFLGYLNQRSFQYWPNGSGDTNLFQVPIFYFDAQQRMAAAVIEFKYRKQSPPVIDIAGISWPARVWTNAHWEPIGDVAVIKEILDGKDQRFDDVRNNGTLKLLMEGKTAAANLTVEEAANFARLMIKTTNERAGIVAGSRGLVSSASDCAVLSPGGKLAFLK